MEMSKQIFLQKSEEEINKELINTVVNHIFDAEITSRAPLGYSSDDFILFSNGQYTRSSQISMRNHSGSLSLLITDKEGDFIFNGGWSLLLGSDLLSQVAFDTINTLKYLIFKDISKTIVSVEKQKTE